MDGASAIQMVCPSQSNADTQPQLQPALLRLSAIISQYFILCRAWILSVDSLVELLFFQRGRGDEFLDARIVPKRIEHRIELEQRRGRRHVVSKWTFIRYRDEVV